MAISPGQADELKEAEIVFATCCGNCDRYEFSGGGPQESYQRNYCWRLRVDVFINAVCKYYSNKGRVPMGYAKPLER